MNPGNPISKETVYSVREFLQSFESLYDAKFGSETTNGIRTFTLNFPPEWRGLNISVKFPTNPPNPDFDITIRSHVNARTIICTTDESLAKVYLACTIQMFEPSDLYKWVSPDFSDPIVDKQETQETPEI